MIEEVIRLFLENELGAPVKMEVPKNPPSAFFIVEKTGSSFSNHIYSSTIAIQSYAPTRYDAAVANEKVKDLMIYKFIHDPDVSKVELNSDYDYTDTQSKRYRYQAVFDITHY